MSIATRFVALPGASEEVEHKLIVCVAAAWSHFSRIKAAMKHQVGTALARARARDCKCDAHELKRARFVTSLDSESTWLCSCVLMRAMCARATLASSDARAALDVLS